MDARARRTSPISLPFMPTDPKVPRGGDRKRIAVVLPLARPAPKPLVRVWRTWVIDRPMVVQFIGERWSRGDAQHAPYPCEPDPQRPEYSFSTNLIDYETGRIIPVSSDEEIAAFRGALPSPMNRA